MSVPSVEIKVASIVYAEIALRPPKKSLPDGRLQMRHKRVVQNVNKLVKP